MTARRQRPSRLRRGGVSRVWVLNAAMAASAAILTLGPLRDLGPVAAKEALPWWLLAAAFWLTETKVVHIEYQREAHSFSLREVPLVVGLFVLSAPHLVLAHVVGAAVALTVHRRQSRIKLAFNLALFSVEAATAAALFHLGVAGRPAIGPAAWLAALGATSAVTVLSSLILVVAISLSEGSPQFHRWPTMAAVALAGALANASIGLCGVTLAWYDAKAPALLVPPLAVLFAAYRLYTTQRSRSERVENLYASTHILQRAQGLDDVMTTLLSHLCRMFRADLAEIALLPVSGDDTPLAASARSDGAFQPLHPVPGPAGPLIDSVVQTQSLLLRRPASLSDATVAGESIKDAMGVVLRGEHGVFGTMIVANRLGEVSTFDDADVQLLEALASHVSVTIENSRLEQKLKHQAFHDSLTGLANRALFIDRVDHALGRRGARRGVSVLFLDLDDFKLVNDGLGHVAGDELLVAVARRVRSCLRAFDTAARLGGDEFAILVEDARTRRDAVRVADRIIEVLSEPFQLLGNQVTVRASIGIVCSDGEASAEELLCNADVAMYRAKEAGKGCYEIFQPSMQAEIQVRHGMKGDLQRAIGGGELMAHYQPIVELESGAITGVEALVRWSHPRRGLLVPGDFIELAEETGLILALGDWMLEEACRQTRAWQVAHPDTAPRSVSVNVSTRQLQHAGFVNTVVRALRTSGLEPRCLVVEITESVLLHDLETAVGRLQQLRELGVRVAIDDFGTGYSSLGYLRRLPIDIVKIDKTFVTGIATAREDRSLTLAIVRLLGTLDVVTVAEGIERPEQLAYMQAMGCDAGQGYYFARPLPPEECEELFSRGEPLGAPAQTAAEQARTGSPIIRLVG